MKTLNHSAVEVLPSLLDRTKVHTIRPAWREIERIPYGESNYVVRIEEKPPRFKVGDKVNHYWRYKSEHKIFCRHCGNPYHITTRDYLVRCIHCHITGPGAISKFLGVSEITDVFSVEFSHIDGMRKILHIGNPFPDERWCNDLARRDGFSYCSDMLDWFEKQYDLSTPKKFYVYRWKWL